MNSKMHLSEQSKLITSSSDKIFAPQNNGKVDSYKPLQLPRITKRDHVLPVPLKTKIQSGSLGEIYSRSTSDLSNSKIKIDMKDTIKSKNKPAIVKEKDNLQNVPRSKTNIDNNKHNNVKDVTKKRGEIKSKRDMKNQKELKMRRPSCVKEELINVKIKEYSDNNEEKPGTVKDSKYEIMEHSSASTNIKNCTQGSLNIIEGDIKTSKEPTKKSGIIFPTPADKNRVYSKVCQDKLSSSNGSSSSDEENELQEEMKLAFNDYLQTFESQNVFHKIETKSSTHIDHQMASLQKRLDKNKQILDSANSRICNINFESIYARLSSIRDDSFQYDVGKGHETSSSAESIASVDCKTPSTRKKRSKSTKLQEDFEIYPEIIEFQSALDDTLSLMEGLHQGEILREEI